jgi:A/G-specific adenine glycosylase
MPDLTVAPGFAAILMEWQQRCGRHDLPWQNTRDPYRVWLSEVMLQQTQVLTVRDYFTRFLARFPDVGALAQAPFDDVMGLWSGLGYYSRARNMHRCAQQIMALHAGSFPQTAAQLQTLPGIGRSTAAAVASICFGERVAIMDGNVKRVLTRYLGFAADLALAVNEQELWKEALRLLPLDNLYFSMPCYSQAVMDLGATICTSRKPTCDNCPLQQECQANAMGTPDQFPVKTRKLKRSAQTIWMLWAESDDGALWLSRRPTPGVWAGLYCFDLFEERETLCAAVQSDWRAGLQDVLVVKHVLTHKDLYLHPVRVRLPRECRPVGQGDWIESGQWLGLGLPAPIRKLLVA